MATIHFIQIDFQLLITFLSLPSAELIINLEAARYLGQGATSLFRIPPNFMTSRMVKLYCNFCKPHHKRADHF